MKKVLLLSCSTGQGHNSCAKAIKEYFSLQGVDCEIRDALDFVSVRFAAFISWGHSFVYRHLPGLFQWGYRRSENKSSSFGETSTVYRFFASHTKKLRQYIIDESFDAVICTHQVGALMLSHIQKKASLDVQTAFVATDYTCYPGLHACYLEKNFISGEEQIEAYLECGIPQNQIIASGIPVRPDIFEHREKGEAKRQLNIKGSSCHLLMMSGSMGCGPMKKILRYVVEELPDNTEITVICGTNKRLYRSLNRKYKIDSRIHIVGYTDEVSLYMDASDLYLTKPGGISVTEAAAKKLPMVFVNAVAGCEQYNMDFFVEIGAAVTAGTDREIATKSISLLCSATERGNMVERLREYNQPNGALRIYRELQKTESRLRENSLESGIA
ncbi:MAG TPA: glycosyltransferase [Oscillospiraceae bacterium]|nr:glycosyltransferase [Oscillospiraceae bacterium]